MTQEFTKEEKRIAKIKHNRFKRQNPEGFMSSLQRFRTELVDKFSKAKIKMDLKSISFNS